MPLYFFDFDGTLDDTGGLLLKTDEQARAYARRAMPGVLEDELNQGDEAMVRSCYCDIRRADGDLIGRISVSMYETRAVPKARPRDHEGE
jgi:hypothetical protein